MSKSFFNPAEYALVADRITEFYERFPTGRIITELVSRERDIVFRADVYRRAEDRAPAATGWASEREGDGEINIVASLENSETSAIGRALANLGFTASRKRPSYEEMQKAERARMRFQQATTALRSETRSRMQVAEAKRSPRAPNEDRADREPSQPSRAQIERGRNLVADVLVLLAEARDNGVPASSLEAFSRKIDTGFVTDEELTQMERRLRHWILNGFSPPSVVTLDSSPPSPTGSAPSVNTPHQ